MTHLHLDPLGGIAGDMFAAALLHAAPSLAEGVARHVRAATGAECVLHDAEDGVLAGRRFEVAVREAGHRHDHGSHHHGSHHEGHHHHAHWRQIRHTLNDGRLPAPVAARATAIFALLADAEARVHGVAPDDVVFHEVGAIDSIADIVAAATLLVGLDVTSASTTPVPLGSGRIRTAHGIMPVPAPASALLLEGIATIDDGIEGERTTPTGAAILRHLAPRSHSISRVLTGTGLGFGTRTLPGIANCLRVLVFADQAPDASIPHRRLAVIAFEIDDQTGEDLAVGIANLRALPFVHDVVQIAAIGKKGRFAVHLQVLADAHEADRAIEACFRETTTIGLRIQHVEARALSRRSETVEAGGAATRVKLVERPGGITAKPESDDIAAAGDAAARARRRRDAVAGIPSP